MSDTNKTQGAQGSPQLADPRSAGVQRSGADDILNEIAKKRRDDSIEKYRKNAAAVSAQADADLKDAIQSRIEYFQGTAAIRAHDPITGGMVNAPDVGRSDFDRDFTTLGGVDDYAVKLGDFRGAEQSAWGQVFNGLGKGIVTAGTTFIDGTIGFGIGLLPGNDLFNNEVYQAMNDIRNMSEEWMPNYKTYEQENSSWYNSANLFSANFVGDTLIKNAGFMVGTGLAGGLWAAPLKTGILAGKIAQWGKKTHGIVTTMAGGYVGAVTESAVEAVGARDEFIKERLGEIDREMEARRQVYADLIKDADVAQSFNLNNQLALEEEQYLKKRDAILKTADDVANAVGWANIPLTMASTVFMFRNVYKPVMAPGATASDYITRSIDNKIAKGAAEAAETAGENATRFAVREAPKGSHEAAKAFAGIMLEGAQEGSQAIASEFGTALGDQLYKSYLETGKMDEDAVYNVSNTLNTLADVAKDKLVSEDFYQEAFVGALLPNFIPRFHKKLKKDGTVGVGVSFGGMFEAFDTMKEEKAAHARAQELVKIMNNSLESDPNQAKIHALARQLQFSMANDQAFLTGKPKEELILETEDARDVLNAIDAFSEAGELGFYESLINSAFKSEDGDLDAIIAATVKKNDKGEFEGDSMFLENGAPMNSTPEGREKMRQVLKDRKSFLDRALKHYKNGKTDSYAYGVRHSKVFSKESESAQAKLYAHMKLWEDRARADYAALMDLDSDDANGSLRAKLNSEYKRTVDEVLNSRKSLWEQVMQDAQVKYEEAQSNYTSKKSELDADIKYEEGEAQESKNTIDSLTKAAEKANKDVETIKERINTLKADIAKKKGELEAFKKTFKEGESQEAHEAKISAMESEIRYMENDLGNQENKLKEAEDIASTANKEAENIPVHEKALKSAEDRLKEYRRLLKEAAAQVDRAYREIADLKKDRGNYDGSSNYVLRRKRYNERKLSLDEMYGAESAEIERKKDEKYGKDNRAEAQHLTIDDDFNITKDREAVSAKAREALEKMIASDGDIADTVLEGLTLAELEQLAQEIANMEELWQSIKDDAMTPKGFKQWLKSKYNSLRGGKGGMSKHWMGTQDFRHIPESSILNRKGSGIDAAEKLLAAYNIMKPIVENLKKDNDPTAEYIERLMKLGAAYFKTEVSLNKLREEEDSFEKEIAKLTEEKIKEENKKIAERIVELFNKADSLSAFWSSVLKEFPSASPANVVDMLNESADSITDKERLKAVTAIAEFATEAKKSTLQHEDDTDIVAECHRRIEKALVNASDLESMTKLNNPHYTEGDASKSVAINTAADFALRNAIVRVDTMLAYRDLFSTKEVVPESTFHKKEEVKDDKEAESAEEAAKRESIENNNSSNIPEEKGAKRYLYPIIPECDIEDAKKGILTDFAEKHPQFKKLWDFCKAKDMFDFVNKGNLKAGDKILFVVDREFEASTKDEEWHTEPTIFMAVKTGDTLQYVGVLPKDRTKVEGLDKLRDKIVSEYNEAQSAEDSKTEPFVSTPTTTVDTVLAGKVELENEPTTLSRLHLLKDKSKIVTVVSEDQAADLEKELTTRGTYTLKVGSTYLLVKNADGKYTPFPVMPAKFKKFPNEVKFNMLSLWKCETAAEANSMLKKMLTVSGDSTGILAKMLYLRNYSLSIEPGKNDPDTIYFTIHDSTQSSGEGRKRIPLGTWEEVRTESTKQSKAMSAIEEAFRELEVTFNTPKEADNATLSLFLDSDCLTVYPSSDLTIKSAYFTANPTDGETEGKAEYPEGFFGKKKDADKAKPDNMDDTKAVTVEGIPVTDPESGVVYYVDIPANTVKDDTGIMIPESDPRHKAYITEAKLSYMYGDAADGYMMKDNLAYIAGEVFDRSTLSFVTDKEKVDQFKKDLGIAVYDSSNPNSGNSSAPGGSGALNEFLYNTILSRDVQNQWVNRSESSRTHYKIGTPENHENYDRMHTALGDNYMNTGKEVSSEKALIRGQAVDEVLRKYFTLRDSAVSDATPISIASPVHEGQPVLSDEAMKSLIMGAESFYKSRKAKGGKFHTDNIAVWKKYNDGTKIAGEMDCLIEYPDGTYEIVDFKTRRGSFHNQDGTMNPYFSEKTANKEGVQYKRMPDLEYYTLQLSGYANLAFNMCGKHPAKLTILPIGFTGTSTTSTKVTKLQVEREINVNYDSRVEGTSVTTTAVRREYNPSATPVTSSANKNNGNSALKEHSNAEGTTLIGEGRAIWEPVSSTDDSNIYMKNGVFSKAHKGTHILSKTSEGESDRSVGLHIGSDSKKVESARDDAADLIIAIANKLSDTAKKKAVDTVVNLTKTMITSTAAEYGFNKYEQASKISNFTDLVSLHVVLSFAQKSITPDSNSEYAKRLKILTDSEALDGFSDAQFIFIGKSPKGPGVNSSWSNYTPFSLLMSGAAKDMASSENAGMNAAHLFFHAYPMVYNNLMVQMAKELVKESGGSLPADLTSAVSKLGMEWDSVLNSNHYKIPPLPAVKVKGSKETKSSSKKTEAKADSPKPESLSSGTASPATASPATPATPAAPASPSVPSPAPPPLPGRPSGPGSGKAFREVLEGDTEGSIKEELAWLNRVLPQFSAEDRVRVVDRLESIAAKGRKAWGSFHKGIITLYNKAAKGTVYHEAFHAVFQEYLSTEDKKAVLREAADRYGNLSPRELEEHLAEDFRVYSQRRETAGIGSAIVRFFKDLFSFIFGSGYSNTRNLFEDIHRGRYATANYNNSKALQYNGNSMNTTVDSHLKHGTDSLMEDFGIKASDLNGYPKGRFFLGDLAEAVSNPSVNTADAVLFSMQNTKSGKALVSAVSEGFTITGDASRREARVKAAKEVATAMRALAGEHVDAMPEAIAVAVDFLEKATPTRASHIKAIEAEALQSISKNSVEAGEKAGKSITDHARRDTTLKSALHALAQAGMTVAGDIASAMFGTGHMQATPSNIQVTGASKASLHESLKASFNSCVEINGSEPGFAVSDRPLTVVEDSYGTAIMSGEGSVIGRVINGKLVTSSPDVKLVTVAGSDKSPIRFPSRTVAVAGTAVKVSDFRDTVPVSNDWRMCKTITNPEYSVTPAQARKRIGNALSANILWCSSGLVGETELDLNRQPAILDTVFNDTVDSFIRERIDPKGQRDKVTFERMKREWLASNPGNRELAEAVSVRVEQFIKDNAGKQIVCSSLDALEMMPDLFDAVAALPAAGNGSANEVVLAKKELYNSILVNIPSQKLVHDEFFAASEYKSLMKTEWVSLPGYAIEHLYSRGYTESLYNELSQVEKKLLMDCYF